MKKLITFFILFVFLASCGPRKKNLQKTEEKLETQKTTDVNSKESLVTESYSSINFSKLIDTYGLKISSKGQNYNLNVGGLVFSGNADLELNSNKEETKVKTIKRIHTTYWSHITYKTIYKVKKITNYKTLQVESKKPSFWLIAFFYLLGLITIPLIKLIINVSIKPTKFI